MKIVDHELHSLDAQTLDIWVLHGREPQERNQDLA
jgi:hypothetical protein